MHVLSYVLCCLYDIVLFWSVVCLWYVVCGVYVMSSDNCEKGKRSRETVRDECLRIQNALKLDLLRFRGVVNASP